MQIQTAAEATHVVRAFRTVVLGMFVLFTCTVALFVAHPVTTAAATNFTLNFQARLETSSGAIVPDGTYNVEFKLYNASSSSGSSQGSCTGDSACLWAETRTSTNQARVANGYLSVNLGSVTAFPSTINWNQQLWLTMNIGGTGGTPSWDGEMSPRILLTAVPYAFQAGALGQTDGSGHIGKLSFNTTTNSPSITLPDASGTVCLQSSSACGFATGSGAAFLQGGNSFGAQAVLGTNDNNSLALRTNNGNKLILDTSGNLQFQQASTINVASAPTSAQLTIQGGAATSGTNVGGNLLLQGGAGASTGASGSVIVKSNTNNSTIAFQVQDASNAPVLTVDTVNGFVGVGNVSPAALLDLATPASADALHIANSASNVEIEFTGNQAANIYQAGTSSLYLNSNTGNIVLGANGNGSQALALQSNGTILLGQASSVNGVLVIQNNSNANTVTLQSGVTAGSYTLTLPTTGPVVSQCLLTDSVTASQLKFGPCTGASGTLQAAYNASAGALPSIDMTSANKGVTLQNDNSSPITGELFGVHVQTASGLGASLFTVDNNGNTLVETRTGNDSTTAFQVQNAAGVNILSAGTSNLAVTVNKGGLYVTDLPVPGSPAVVAGANTGGTLSGAASTTYYYVVTALNAAGESLKSTEASINGQSFTKIADNSSSLTATASGTAGNVSCNNTAGQGCKYKVTFVTANGESLGDTGSTSLLNVTSKQVNLTNIPTSASAAVTARNIYRSKNGGAYLFDQTIANNTATTATDNVLTASGAYPVSSTATTNTNNATITWSAVTGATSYRIYRGTSAGGETAYQTSASSPFTDTGAAGTAQSPPARSTVSQVGVGTSTPSANLDVEGTALFKNAADSKAAFQIQNAAGSNLLRADTSDMGIGIGTGISGSPVATLQVASSGSGEGNVLADAINQTQGMIDVGAGITPTVSGGTLANGGPTARGDNASWISTATGQTLTMDLGAPIGVSYITFSTYWRGDTTAIPKGYTIAHSGDNITYTTDVTVTTNGNATVSHYIGGTFRYWRITVTAFQSGQTQSTIEGLQLLSTYYGGLVGDGSQIWGQNVQLTGQNVFLRAQGNVGIGTTSPNYKLAIQGNTASTTASFEGLIQLNASDGQIGELYHDNNGTNSYLGIESYNVGNTVKTPVVLQEFGGNVGIGTSTPGEVLTISNNGSPWMGYVNNGTSGRHWQLGDGITVSNGLFQLQDVTANRTDLTVDSSGNLGVGTTGPGSRLEVNGTITITNGSGGQLAWPSGGSNTYLHESWGVQYPGDSTHPFQVSSAGLLVGYAASGGTLNSGYANFSGNVGIGTSATNWPLQVKGTGPASYGGQLLLQSSAGGSGWGLGPDTSANNLTLYDMGTGCGGVYILAGGSTWNARCSDERLKKNITPLPANDGLQSLRQITPVSYSWIDSTSPSDLHWGVIAQSVQQVYPFLVQDTGDRTITMPDGTTQFFPHVLTVDSSDLIWPTIMAVKDLDGEVTSLAGQLQIVQNNHDFTWLNVAGNMTADTLTVINDATFKANIIVQGHIITGGDTPAATPQPAAGVDSQGNVDAACTVSGNDTSGTISVTSGSHSVTNGEQCLVAFAKTFGSAPHLVLSPMNQESASVGVYINVTTADFGIYFSQPALSHHSYVFNYVNLQ